MSGEYKMELTLGSMICRDHLKMLFRDDKQKAS